MSLEEGSTHLTSHIASKNATDAVYLLHKNCLADEAGSSILHSHVRKRLSFLFWYVTQVNNVL